jgi:hypothetical protein
MIKELPIPPDAHTAKQAVEIFRAWIIDGPLQCSLFPTVWKDDPSTWGMLLADAASHIANALQEECGLDRETILQSIKLAFVSELENATDEREGAFQK